MSRALQKPKGLTVKLDRTYKNHDRATSRYMKQAKPREAASLFLSTTAAAPAPDAPPAERKQWTVLYYGAADNDLYDYIYKDVSHMEQVGSDPQANLVVQLDHRKGTTQRYLIQKDTATSDPLKIDSPVLQDLGATNMSDPQNLSDFIKWGIKQYPAEHYILVVADHGKGWKGCCADESHKGWMDLTQLKDGLATAQKDTGVKLDIVGFDACLMASTEVAYQLKDMANYMVASQEVEGQEGWPYNLILDPTALQSLSMSAAISPHAGEPKQIAQYLVSRTSKENQTLPTMSAIDLGRIGGVANAAKELKDAILTDKVSGKALRILRKEAQNFADFNDLHDFADRLKDSDVASNQVKEKARLLSEALDSSVIAEQHSEKYPRAHGLTAELRWPKGYEKTDFAKATGWNELINYMNTNPA